MFDARKKDELSFPGSANIADIVYLAHYAWMESVYISSSPDTSLPWRLVVWWEYERRMDVSNHSVSAWSVQLISTLQNCSLTNRCLIWRWHSSSAQVKTSWPSTRTLKGYDLQPHTVLASSSQPTSCSVVGLPCGRASRNMRA